MSLHRCLLLVCVNHSPQYERQNILFIKKPMNINYSKSNKLHASTLPDRKLQKHFRLNNETT